MSKKHARQSQPSVPPGSYSHAGIGIAGSALQMVSRLRDHIERIDNGIVYAIDDLAVVLRTLLCNGTGNGVLRRLYQECGIDKPSVLLSRAPEVGAQVQFSVGSIPSRESGAVADGAVYVPLGGWPNKDVLVVTLGGERQIYTWEALLSSYANKWGGAHLDVTVPPHLQFIDLYAAGGLNLTSYLLRSAAVEVWLLAQSVFRKTLPVQTGSLSAQELDKVTYSAEGGINSAPRDISNGGQLQWFCHSTDRLDLMWYVDEHSEDNALHVQLGDVPYDFRYSSNAVQAGDQPVPVSFQAPRHRVNDGAIKVDGNKLKTLPLDGQIKTLSQVRSATPT